MSDKAHEFLESSLVCIYAQLLPRIRECAKTLGYAVALHGTMKRDLDLIAVPWVEDAKSAAELVEMIARNVAGFVVGKDVDGKIRNGEVEHIDNPTKHPHGRLSWNICWGGRAFIDLSVMPRVSSVPSPL